VLLEFSEPTKDRLALALTPLLKLLGEALLDGVRTGPALQLPTRFVVGAVDVSQHPKHLLLGGLKVDGRIVRRHRSE
jgi:hypothetical protein